jgi:hypothetical protein
LDRVNDPVGGELGLTLLIISTVKSGAGDPFDSWENTLIDQQRERSKNN